MQKTETIIDRLTDRVRRITKLQTEKDILLRQPTDGSEASERMKDEKIDTIDNEIIKYAAELDVLRWLFEERK